MSTVFRHNVKKLLSSKTFTKYLLFTNIAISGTVDFVGDFTEQRVVEVVQPHDWGRTGRMGLIGLLFGAPDHYWYKYLDTRYPGRDRLSVSRKVLLDLLIMGTLGTVAFYVGEERSEMCSRVQIRGKQMYGYHDQPSWSFPFFRIEQTTYLRHYNHLFGQND